MDTLADMNTQAAFMHTSLMPKCNNEITKISFFSATI